MNIQQVEQLRILVIGDSCDDVYHYGTCDRLSPEAPIPVFKESHIEVRPGMSANVVANLKSLGAHVSHASNRKKIEKHRYIDSRFNQHLLRVDTGEDGIVPSFDLQTILHHQFDAIVISDYNKGFLDAEMCRKICNYANENDILLFVDSKKKDLSCFKNCYIKINENEYNSACNIPKDSELIITLGDKGAMYKNKTYPAKEVEVFDVCGAGDVFLSTFILFFLLTNDVNNAIIKANECATFSVSKMGTYIMTKKDLCEIGFYSE
tara:strand:- start:7964 stop:8755 length:792 start_codon:yes stop_codon:yes gene_type:complete